MQAWQTENRDGIRRFATLLEKLLAVVKNEKRMLLEVYCPGVDRLEVRSQYGSGTHALPMQLAGRWAEDGEDGGFDTPGLSVDEDYGLDRDEKKSGYNDRWVLDRDFDDDDDDEGSDNERDFTACSADGCGYCGKCTY